MSMTGASRARPGDRRVPLWGVRVCSCVCVPLFYVKDSSVRVRACVVCEGQ